MAGLQCSSSRKSARPGQLSLVYSPTPSNTRSFRLLDLALRLVSRVRLLAIFLACRVTSAWMRGLPFNLISVSKRVYGYQRYIHVMQTLITPTSMSKDLHPLQLAIEDSRNSGLWGHTYRKPSQPDFDGYLTYSSSPARSSSPPSTPYSSRRDPGYAYLRSSPDVAADALYKQRGIGYWGRPALSSKSLFSSPSASGSSIYDHQYSSQDDTYNQFLDSDGPRNDIPSDSEEDVEDISHVRSDDSCYRTTFFRVSAERGLWRSDPIPLRKTTPSTPQVRKSVPTFSRVPTPLPLTIRTVSEPAPSNNSQMSGFYLEKEDVPAVELPDPVLADAGEPPTRFAPSLDSKPEDEISSPHTLPSLIADAESSEDDANIELELDVPSSPLPPSSPPLSPLSRSVSIISRSSSPLPFAFEGSFSPLSELPDEYDNDDIGFEERFTLNDSLGMQIIEQTIIPPLKTEDHTEDPEHESEIQTSCSNLAQREQDLSPSKPRLSCLDDPLAFSPSPVPIISSAKVTTLSREDITLDSDDTFSSTFGPTAATSSASPLRCMVGRTDVEMASNSSSPVPSTISLDEDSKDPCPSRSESSALKDKNGVMHRSSNTVRHSSSRDSSRKAREWEGKEQNTEGRPEKQNDVERDDGKSSDVKVKKVNGKKRMVHDDEEDVENDGSSSAGGSRHKRMKRMNGDNVASRSTKRIPKPKRRTCPPSTSGGDEIDEPLDAEARELHATVCGLVIETMATSRASSLPTSSIFKLVMSLQPSLKSQRSEQDWLRIFERVLQDGAAERGSGVFGKVESSGKDASDRPLEAQWFYVPERDEDQERAALIRSMMPRPGKRTETMKYKQYYWRPLEKISKWDPEDAL